MSVPKSVTVPLPDADHCLIQHGRGGRTATVERGAAYELWRALAAQLDDEIVQLSRAPEVDDPAGRPRGAAPERQGA